jgi:hypothetical protein
MTNQLALSPLASPYFYHPFFPLPLSICFGFILPPLAPSVEQVTNSAVIKRIDNISKTSHLPLGKEDICTNKEAIRRLP